MENTPQPETRAGRRPLLGSGTAPHLDTPATVVRVAIKVLSHPLPASGPPSPSPGQLGSLFHPSSVRFQRGSTQDLILRTPFATPPLAP